MAVELRHLRYLLAVAEHANFTRAAEELHISQPTLSQQIKQLERAVGAQLLDRTGRAVRLTDAGATYADHARRALRDLAAAERAVHDVRDLSRGHLRLAVTPSFSAYLVGPLTAALHAKHPGITLTVEEMPQERIEPALLADTIDLGIAFGAAHAAGIGADPLYAETLSLVVGATHPDARRPAGAPPLTTADLAERQLALLTSDFTTRGHVDGYLARHRVSPRIAVEANSIQALAEIVRHAPLATVLPDAVADGHPDLVRVAVDPPLSPRIVVLLGRTGTYRSAAAGAFTRIAHEVVRGRGYAGVGVR